MTTAVLPSRGRIMYSLMLIVCGPPMPMPACMLTRTTKFRLTMKNQP